MEGAKNPPAKHMRSYIQESPWGDPGESQDCPDGVLAHQLLHSSSGGQDDSWSDTGIWASRATGHKSKP